MKRMTEDERFMKEAVRQAKKAAALGDVPIGCVIVQENKIIARGYNRRMADKNTLSHAEIIAIKKACKKAGDWRLEDCELYVTLEPCCHWGRTPPCTDAILEHKIARVVVGCLDPNPLVAGKGVELLRAHGVEVTTGVLEGECKACNAVFFHYIQTKTPFVVLKYAMTLDGKIAAYTGASRWITREAARRHVHEMRHRYRGILAGVGTVLSDDPLLTCRMENGRNPVRVICDTRLRTPLDSRIVRTANEVETILATCETDGERIAPYTAAGCQVWQLPAREGHVDLSALMDRLGAAEIDGVLLEGGGTLNWSMLEAGLVQRVQAYIAPKLLGGAGARSPVEGRGVEAPDQAAHLRKVTVTALGEDFLLEGEVDRDVYGTH